MLALQPPGAQTAVADPVQRLRRLHQNVAPHTPRAVRALPVALEQAHQIEVQLAHRTVPYRLFRNTARNLVTGTGMVNRRVPSEQPNTCAAVHRRLRPHAVVATRRWNCAAARRSHTRRAPPARKDTGGPVEELSCDGQSAPCHAGRSDSAMLAVTALQRVFPCRRMRRPRRVVKTPVPPALRRAGLPALPRYGHDIGIAPT